MNRRVVVTSAGVVSALGVGLDKFACGLFAGQSAAAPSLRLPGVNAAEIGEFDPREWLGNKGIRVLDRSATLLAVAARMALCSAGLNQDLAYYEDLELGLVCGTVFGSVHSIAAFDWSGITDGPNYVNPMEFPNTVISSPAGHAAIKHKLRGVNSTICAGLASGLHAIHYAAEFLRFGRASALLAGGVEELCEEAVLGFSKTEVISQSCRPRPFDPKSDGLVPGEGSGLWMLETEDSARNRARVPWLEICGLGSVHSANGIEDFDASASAAAEAMNQSLAYSAIAPDQVGCIVCSANGSRVGDQLESAALERVFGTRLPNIPLCAPKAAFGEALGASGALCAITAGLALLEQKVPPTMGHVGSRNGLRLSGQSLPFAGEYALVNAFGSDGNNASLVVRLWQN
jgi:3-oxoacyl-[acyl-carrier-protein] synthase II